MTTAPQATPQKTEKAAQTMYVILAEGEFTNEDGDTGNAWTVEDTTRATSASQAIKKFAEARDHAEGTQSLIAIPERSWRPTKVTVETSKIVKLG